MEIQAKPEYDDYCDKVDILVNTLKEYLIESLKTSPREYDLLLKEKEGWVEYQIEEWLGRKIKEKYGWSAWDVSPIDVMAILTCQVVAYIKFGGNPRSDFSSPTIEVSSTTQ